MIGPAPAPPQPAPVARTRQEFPNESWASGALRLPAQLETRGTRPVDRAD